MVGLERAVIPKFAETVFGISGHTALLSFIVAFGLAKSVANMLMTGNRKTKRCNLQKTAPEPGHDDAGACHCGPVL